MLFAIVLYFGLASSCLQRLDSIIHSSIHPRVSTAQFPLFPPYFFFFFFHYHHYYYFCFCICFFLCLLLRLQYLPICTAHHCTLPRSHRRPPPAGLPANHRHAYDCPSVRPSIFAQCFAFRAYICPSICLSKSIHCYCCCVARARARLDDKRTVCFEARQGMVEQSRVE